MYADTFEWFCARTETVFAANNVNMYNKEKYLDFHSFVLWVLSLSLVVGKPFLFLQVKVLDVNSREQLCLLDKV